MDHPNLLSSSASRFPPKSHMRSASRSPTRPRLTDDILADLSPTTTLEAFTSASGSLKASIEAASPSQREFGIRAALASKKIHEWAAELSAWRWPANGSEGFENPLAKRRKLSQRTVDGSPSGRLSDLPFPKDAEVYWGCLPSHEVIKYETRIDEVSQDMEDLDVEAIKSLVLDTHVQSRTRPSSSREQQPMSPAFLSYNGMDDFTAVLTATVLQTLPSLSRLTKLMDIWSVRLAVLRQVSPLMAAMGDAETVLKSAWTTIQSESSKTSSSEEIATISQNDYEVIRDVLQDKVTVLGRRLDQMLDMLEGREDTLPEEWLDHMEAIEQDYGEWCVSAERKVREAAWAKEAAKSRQTEEVKKASSSVAKQTISIPEGTANDASKLARPASTSVYNADLGSIHHRLADSNEQSKPKQDSSPISDTYNQPVLKPLPLSSSFSVSDGKRDPTWPQNAPIDSIRSNGGTKPPKMALLPTIEGQSGRASAPPQNEPSISQISLSPIPPARQPPPPGHENLASLPPQLDGACFSVGPEPMRLANSTASSKTVKDKEPTAKEQERKRSSIQTYETDRSVLSGRNFVDTMSAQQIQVPIAPFPLGSRTSSVQISPSKSEDYMPNYANGHSPPVKVPKYGHPLANSLRRDIEDRESRGSSSKSSSDRSDAIQMKEAIKESKPKKNKAVKSAEPSEKAEATKSVESTTIGAVPRTIEVPQTEVTSKAPEAVKAMEVNNILRNPQECESRKANEVPKVVEDHNVMEGAKVTEASEASETAKVIDTFENARALPSSEDPHLARDSLMNEPLERNDALKTESPEILETPQIVEGPEIIEAPEITQGLKVSEVSETTELPQTSQDLLIKASPTEPPATFETAEKTKATKAVEDSKTTEASQKILEDATELSTESQTALMTPGKAESTRIAGQGKLAIPDALISSSDILGTESKGSTSTSAPVDSRSPHIDLHLPLPPPGAATLKSPAHFALDDNASTATKGHTRGPSTASAISGYASSEPSPEIKEAEPTEYFRPVSPPIMGKIERTETPDVLTPTRATFIPLEQSSRKSNIATKDGGPSPKSISEGNSPTLDHVIRHSWTASKTTKDEDSARERSNSSLSESELQGSKFPAASIGFPQNATQQIERQRQLSISSDSPSISEILLESNTRTPPKVSPQNSESIYGIPSTDKKSLISLTDYDEDSPSLGRVRAYDEVEKYSTPNSPLPDLQVMKRRPSELSTNTSFDTDSLYPDSPMTPAEAPVLDNIDVSPTRGLSYPSRPSDDQLQQQISEILESIPTTKIRLASELNTSKLSSIPRLMKKTSRSSLAPASRPMSRAPSPSFTLAPAYAKNPRPRPQNGNPEIKLYHLSRSTGEAPIKLFVRLVGEHGERVMVRVGGGWADLGEYLKEYASHHGRRTDKDGKVEIQDVPRRNVSMGSNASTIRNGGGNISGRSSPVSRPASSLERPLSSLAIRKTRKSVGEESRIPGFRSPSTPLPHAFRSSPSMPRQVLDTPPSGRSVSRLEWTEEESSLGLAGPKGRKVDISEKDAAWVESMKEKVRLASAEKEKKAGEGTFGEMDRVGGTKRLFKKSVP